MLMFEALLKCIGPKLHNWWLW